MEYKPQQPLDTEALHTPPKRRARRRRWLIGFLSVLPLLGLIMTAWGLWGTFFLLPKVQTSITTAVPLWKRDLAINAEDITSTVVDQSHVPEGPLPTIAGNIFVTVVKTINFVTTATRDRPPRFRNCCPTVISRQPNYFYCPSPAYPSLTLQCPYPTSRRPGEIKALITTSTLSIPCSEQPTSCHLENGDFCIPKTIYIPNPVACPTKCAPLPPATTVVTHVVIADPHKQVCVVDDGDDDSGALRDATEEEKWAMAGGKGWYHWDHYLKRPGKSVARLLGELGSKGFRRLLKTAGIRDPSVHI